MNALVSAYFSDKYLDVNVLVIYIDNIRCDVIDKNKKNVIDKKEMAEMTKDTSNLKEVMVSFQISNTDLAKAVQLDPSLISRYVSGNRILKADSKHADAIAEYLLIKADTAERIGWLKEQLEASNLITRSTSVLNMKNSLISWISTGGEVTLDGSKEAGETGDGQEKDGDRDRAKGMMTGVLPIADAVSEFFASLKDGEEIDIFLTSDRIRILADDSFSEMVRSMISGVEKDVVMNIVIGVSGNTQQINKIIQRYMGGMISGKMRFYTFYGAAQNVVEQLYFIFRNRGVIMVTESPIGLAEPVGTLITDSTFVEEISQSFNATYRYSQPMFNIYNDSYTRNMIEVLYGEYCLPGALCVVKDSVNPMYMTYEAYCRVLRKDNSDDAEYAWKCNEYRRFHDGFRNMLSTRMQCREIISLSRLRKIIEERKCTMAGLYFLTTGFFDLDLEGCRDILTGYIENMNLYPNFSLLILDDLPELHGSSCWHVKQARSIAINDWNREPIMCESHHASLVQEFQRHFDAIWERGTGALRNRAYIISILEGIIQEMNEILEEENFSGLSQ